MQEVALQEVGAQEGWEGVGSEPRAGAEKGKALLGRWRWWGCSPGAAYWCILKKVA